MLQFVHFLQCILFALEVGSTIFRSIDEIGKLPSSFGWKLHHLVMSSLVLINDTKRYDTSMMPYSKLAEFYFLLYHSTSKFISITVFTSINYIQFYSITEKVFMISYMSLGILRIQCNEEYQNLFSYSSKESCFDVMLRKIDQSIVTQVVH